MGFLVNLFKALKSKSPEPYDWIFLKERCLLAIDTHSVFPTSAIDQLDQLDEDRLSASGSDAKYVVWKVLVALTNAEPSSFPPIFVQEYLDYAAEVLRFDVGSEEAASRLREKEYLLN